MEVLIRSVDLETSDMQPPEGEVLEIGWTDVTYDTEAKVCTISDPQRMLFKPTKPLKPANVAVHHLTERKLAPYPVCEPDDLVSVARSGSPFALVAHNWAFENRWFTPEVMGETHAVCTMKAGRRLFPDAESHGNQAMRYLLGLDLDEEKAMPPHAAGPDSYVTAHVFAEYLKIATVSEMVKMTKAPLYYPVCPIGKHRGWTWDRVPATYLQWMMRENEMEADLKAAALAELELRRGGPSK